MTPIKPRVYADVVELLGQLHESAKAGDVTGLVIGVQLRGHKKLTDIAGTCLREATDALGLVSRLEHELHAIIDARQSDQTR